MSKEVNRATKTIIAVAAAILVVIVAVAVLSWQRLKEFAKAGSNQKQRIDTSVVTIQLKSNTVTRGQNIEYTITGLTPSTSFTSGLKEAGEFKAISDAAGSYSVAFKVDDPAGFYTVFARDEMGRKAEVKVQLV